MKFFERNTAANLMMIYSSLALFSASFYHWHLAEDSSGWDIDLIFMMNFCKFHMLAVNYKNAGLLDDPVGGKHLTSRERKFAEPLRERVRTIDFWHFYLFCGSSWTGPAHEYLHFD